MHHAHLGAHEYVVQLQVQPRDVTIHCSATFDGGRNARSMFLKYSAMTFYAIFIILFLLLFRANGPMNGLSSRCRKARLK